MHDNSDLIQVTNNVTSVTSCEHGFYKYLQKINIIPSLSQEEEFLLAKSYLENEDLSAAHKLVSSHLKLVAKIAVRYKNYGLPWPELVSEGNIGLMQAVKKYNPDLGFRLSTYAMWWIKASIQEYILRSWSLVKIGTTTAQKKLFFSLAKIKRKLTNLYSRSLTENDFSAIAREIGVSTADVAEMNIRLKSHDLSLNNNIDEDGNELIDFLPEKTPNQEVMFIQKQESANKHKLLKEAMTVLNEREYHILTERKLKYEPSTLEVLSHYYNVSKERIRQIEEVAFKKIQKFILDKTSTNNIIRIK
jgi:RNA polymerase sigma-32 factor